MVFAHLCLRFSSLLDLQPQEQGLSGDKFFSGLTQGDVFYRSDNQIFTPQPVMYSWIWGVRNISSPVTLKALEKTGYVPLGLCFKGDFSLLMSVC